MNKNCCGEKRKTRFCADCGRKLRDGSVLEEILAYCKIRAVTTRRDAKKATSEYALQLQEAERLWKSDAEDDKVLMSDYSCPGRIKERRDKECPKRDETAERWESWTWLLQQLLGTPGIQKNPQGEKPVQKRLDKKKKKLKKKKARK